MSTSKPEARATCGAITVWRRRATLRQELARCTPATELQQLEAKHIIEQAAQHLAFGLQQLAA